MCEIWCKIGDRAKTGGREGRGSESCVLKGRVDADTGARGIKNYEGVVHAQIFWRPCNFMGRTLERGRRFPL